MIAVTKDAFANNEMIGVTQVSLNDLQDQMVHEAQYQLSAGAEFQD